jgi:hypothetical protein
MSVADMADTQPQGARVTAHRVLYLRSVITEPRPPTGGPMCGAPAILNIAMSDRGYFG